MKDNIDVDVSDITEGLKTPKEMSEVLLEELVRVCNGKVTKAEAFGFSDIAIDHICRFI